MDPQKARAEIFYSLSHIESVASSSNSPTVLERIAERMAEAVNQIETEDSEECHE